MGIICILNFFPCQIEFLIKKKCSVRHFLIFLARSVILINVAIYPDKMKLQKRNCRIFFSVSQQYLDQVETELEKKINILSYFRRLTFSNFDS